MALIHLLRRAAEDIRTLRRRNEILSAQMRVVEIFGAALSGRGGSGIAMGEDIAWALDRAIHDLENEAVGTEAAEQQEIP